MTQRQYQAGISIPLFEQIARQVGGELLRRILKEHPWAFGAYLALSVLMVAAVLYVGNSTKEVINLLFAHLFSQVGVPLATIIAAGLAAFLVDLVSEQVNTRITSSMFHRIRIQLCNQVLTIKTEHLVDRGYIDQGVQKHPQLAEKGVNDGYLPMFKRSIFVGGTVLLLIAQSPYLAVGPITAMVVTFWFANRLAQIRQGYLQKIKELEDEASLHLRESTEGYLVLKALPGALARLAQFEKISEEIRDLRVRELRNWRLSNALTGVVLPLALPAAMIAVAILTRTILTFGGWSAFTLEESLALSFFGTLQRDMVRYAEAIPSLRSVFDLLKRSREEDGNQHPETITGGIVEITDLCFTFPPKMKLNKRKKYDLVIDNLILRPGKAVIAIGLSNSGKSTLVKLLLRLFKDYVGAIKVDGVDLKEFTRAWLRTRIGYVPQEAPYFSEDVLSNLQYASEKATKFEAFQLLATLNMGQMLDVPLADALPRLGHLSGGEKQRLAVGRLLLQQPLILILDEHTASLDPENEKQVFALLDPLFLSKSSLTIAHKATIVRHYLAMLKHGKLQEVEVVYLQEGEIVERVACTRSEDFHQAGPLISQWMRTQRGGETAGIPHEESWER